MQLLTGSMALTVCRRFNIIRAYLYSGNCVYSFHFSLHNITFMKYFFTFFLSCWIAAASSQSIINITPAAGNAGNVLTAQVTGSGLYFMTASPPGIHSVKLANYTCNLISGTNIQVIDDNHFNVDLNLPSDATNGLYDVRVRTELAPNLDYTIPAGFSVTNGVDRSLVSVTPNQIQAGDSTTTVVEGLNIQNMVDSGGFVIHITNGTEQYTGFNISTLDANHINVDFAPLPWATNGFYNVSISSNKGCFFLSQGIEVQGGLPRAIVSVNPNQGTAGNVLNAQVTGRYLYFMTASPPGVQQIKLVNSTCNEIQGSNFSVVDDDHVNADFNIPLDATNGLYDLLLTVMGGDSYTLPAGFSITGGLTREITSCGPSPALASTVFVAGIGGLNLQSMLDTTTVIKLTSGNNFILTGTNFTVINPDSITVEFNIPPYADNGFYDLDIASLAGCYSLIQAVEVTGGAFRGITAINPFEAYKGQSLTAQITGQYVYFMTGTSTSGGIYSISLHNSNFDNIQGSNISVVDTDHVNVDFSIPYAVHKGFYDVTVNTVGGPYTLPNGFEVKGTVISGKVYLDVDSNGVMDGVDYGMANKRVRLLPDSTISFTDANGFYHFAVDPGTYDVEFVVDSNWLITSSPPLYTITVSNTDTTGLDFGINPVTDEYNMLAVLTGMAPRCGWTREYTVTYSNHSTTTTHGLVSLNLDADLTYASASPAPDNINGNIYEWEYDTLHVNETRDIHVMVTMPVAGGTVLNSILCVNAEDQQSNVLASNCDTLNQVVTCSYDPNDKSVEPEGEGPSHYVLRTSDLDYLIRFQNTGNDTAFMVLIMDTIDPSLDLNSLTVIASSHPVETTIRPGRVVEFRFNNILLPDSIVDEIHSHGFVKYSIHPLSGLPESTVVNNSAYIYFDLNSAVITNEVTSTLVSTIGIMEYAWPSNSFVIFPDPVSDQSTLEFERSSNAGYEILIADAMGRTVEVMQISGTKAIIRKNNLGAGIYFVIARDMGNGQLSRGKFVIR